LIGPLGPKVAYPRDLSVARFGTGLQDQIPKMMWNSAKPPQRVGKYAHIYRDLPGSEVSGPLSPPTAG